MNVQTPTRPVPPKIPSTPDKFLKLRKLKAQRTLNDQIEDIHIALLDNPAYMAFLEAVYDEQAVEGSLAADNIMAASVIRDKAAKMDNGALRNQKLATIAKALGVVLRRYGVSRKERRNMIGGEIVPGDSGD